MQHYCEIPTFKGTMRGFFHKPNVDKHPVCIIFHGFTGQKTGTKFSYVQLARMLEAKGIATFRFDFLGSGEQMSERVCHFPNGTGSIDNMHRVFKNGSLLSPTLL